MLNNNQKETFDLYLAIVKRAQSLGIAIGEQITQIMDVQFADKQFHLRLKEWLEAEDFDFIHDFIGIQANMDRQSCKMGNCFLPRFAE